MLDHEKAIKKKNCILYYLKKQQLGFGSQMSFAHQQKYGLS